MDKDRLQRLRIRFCTAQQIANDLDMLEKSKLDKSRLRASLKLASRGEELLTEEILFEIIRIGRDAMIAQKEAELETLLAVEPQIGPIATGTNDSPRRILAVSG